MGYRDQPMDIEVFCCCCRWYSFLSASSEATIPAIRHYLGPPFLSLSFVLLSIYKREMRNNNNALLLPLQLGRPQRVLVLVLVGGVHLGHFPDIKLINSMTYIYTFIHLFIHS